MPGAPQGQAWGPSRMFLAVVADVLAERALHASNPLRKQVAAFLHESTEGATLVILKPLLLDGVLQPSPVLGRLISSM